MVTRHNHIPWRERVIPQFILAALFLNGCQTPTTHVESTTARIPVVLTTDCGADMDDQWALAHSLLSPEIDLRLIVTSHATLIGQSSRTAAKNAVAVIANVAPNSKTRVVAGSDKPLRSPHLPLRNSGVGELMRASRTFSATNRLNVFIIGAGTDVASALLLDPSIADRITVISMGFDDWPNGGDGFNVKNDPLAWQAILESRVPIVIGSNAVTRRDLRLTRAQGAALMRPHGPIGDYLNSLFDAWLTERADLVTQFFGPDAWAVWDEVVVAYVLGFTRGIEVPRPKLKSDLSFEHVATRERITWLTHIDAERTWRDFTLKIDDARSH